jgi:hypothetical protein
MGCGVEQLVSSLGVIWLWVFIMMNGEYMDER